VPAGTVTLPVSAYEVYYEYYILDSNQPPAS